MTTDTLQGRLRAFIAHKQLSIKKFEESCGLSNGYVNSMRKGMGSERMEHVLSIYPELSREWLLFGEGEMLKSSPVSSKREGVDSKREGVGSAPQAPSEKDIVEFRKSLNLTQLAFAAKIGINQGYMSAIEQGKRPLTETVLAAIAKAFGPAAAKDLCAPPPKPEAADAAVAPDKALDKALDEIAEQRKLVAKAQEQIDRLITLLEKVSNN